MFVRLKIRACLLFLASLILLLSACSGGNQAGSTPQIVAQTVVVTQVVTQVILPTDTPPSVITTTPEPTITPVPLTAAPTYDPYSAPIYYPLPDCVASRLHRGDKAFVTFGGGPNAIRYGTDLHNDTVLGYAQEGEVLEIVDGPYCNSGWIVWMVRTASGVVGYTPEGSGNEYWLLPVGP